MRHDIPSHSEGALSAWSNVTNLKDLSIRILEIYKIRLCKLKSTNQHESHEHPFSRNIQAHCRADWLHKWCCHTTYGPGMTWWCWCTVLPSSLKLPIANTNQHRISTMITPIFISIYTYLYLFMSIFVSIYPNLWHSHTDASSVFTCSILLPSFAIGPTELQRTHLWALLHNS